jgi:hypothetical protein
MFFVALDRLVELLLNLNPFQEVDGAFKVLAELFLGKVELLHRFREGLWVKLSKRFPEVALTPLPARAN